jgi:hypothetical protein
MSITLFDFHKHFPAFYENWSFITWACFHHSMARAKVANGEHCLKYVDVSSRQGVVFQMGFGRGANNSSP